MRTLNSNLYFTKYKFNKHHYWKRKLGNHKNEKFDTQLLAPTNKNIIQSKKLFKENIDIINIETSSYCNRKCSYCPVSVYGREDKINISKSLLNSILNGLKDIGYNKAISLNLYNEPLASDNFYEILKIIKKKLPKSIIGTNSNGDYIKNSEILEKLSDFGLNRIKITAHTPPGRNFSKEYMIFRMEEFAKRINYKIKKKDLDKFYFSFKIKNLVGIFQCPNWMKIGNSRGGTIKSLNKKNVRTSPCVKPFREFTIYYDGSVTPCCDIYHGNNYSKYIVKKLSSKDKNEIFKVYAGKALSLWRKDLFTWSEKKDICGSCSAPDLAERKDQKKRKKILSINNLKI